MMMEYHLSDHWTPQEPTWTKALVSALYRRGGSTTVLPLTVAVAEVANWVELASGTDAWNKPANRASLRADLDESVAALGSALRAQVAERLNRFDVAFARLTTSGRTTLSQPPGTRTDAAWADMSVTCQALLTCLESTPAVAASWDDLVEAAQNPPLDRREHRAIADLLFDQLRRRGLDATSTFRRLVSELAYGPSPRGLRTKPSTASPAQRAASARAIACTPATVEPVVVWLGYQERVAWHVSAGRVTFVDAHWAVPGATLPSHTFEHRDELAMLVEHDGMFKVAARADDTSDVDCLVRVDLGETTAADAVTRAAGIVDTILNVSIHNTGGTRPHLAQYGVLRSGRPSHVGYLATGRQTGFTDDQYGASLTADGLAEHGPAIAEALAREELPRFLGAALQVQTAAERPFSRDLALRTPAEADISSVIPLADRVVQHVAANAALDPNVVFEDLGTRWAHVRWRADLHHAVYLCLLGGDRSQPLHRDLSREWYTPTVTRPRVLFISEHARDLSSLCRVESERAWVERMFASTTDHRTYATLVDAYAAEGTVLEARRRRVRNALVHGNPASFAVVESVREYAEFLSGTALRAGLEAYVQGLDPAATLQRRSGECEAMRAGLDAATYWRAQVAAVHAR